MPVDPSDDSTELTTAAKETGESIYSGMLDTLLTGVAITIPLLITLYVVQLGLDFVHNALRPVIALLQWFGIIERIESVQLIAILIDIGIYSVVIDFLTELITIALLLGLVMVVGTVGRNRHGERIIDSVDLLIASIPGVGTVYKSFRRMGDVMLSEEAENFQDVKLVEALDDDLYVLGFKTSDSPATIETATGHEDMIAMFLPLAPNPVTGGFLTYVPENDVYDVDMSIEEGVRSILTSGIATGEGAAGTTELTMGDLGTIADLENLQDALVADESRSPADESRSPADESRSAPDESSSSADDDGRSGDR